MPFINTICELNYIQFLSNLIWILIMVNKYNDNYLIQLKPNEYDRYNNFRHSNMWYKVVCLKNRVKWIMRYDYKGCLRKVHSGHTPYTFTK